MFSGVKEKKMRIVRASLVFGWVVLIVSLFWDPITPQLTHQENVSSPFHLSGKVVEVQGKVLAEEPYEMSNRIFWTMIIPVLPLFFLVAGHETWRRICPLSFVSQIPRYLGWNRKRAVLIRRTGQIEKQLALVGRDSWWRRNVWYIQFGLLFLALNARILLVNSDRTALGLFFIAVIIVALAVGYFWGGKTWCNYICPIAIVQKIYTEPRGLLDSQANTTRQPITQSMCRTSSAEGDRSICVGCTPNCPDIDIERSYWEGIEDPALRHVYYGFFGLIVGFYCFYYFYSGGWDYYFSGAWTHERDQIGNLFKTGMYINGTAIGIPKIISSPLILAAFVLAAVALGKSLEALFRYIVKRAKLPLTEPEIINRCLTFSAYISINTFYLFGGRPNLMLLPGPALRLVDIVIVALTTLWFWQAIQRNPMRYRREGLASSLMEQLRKLKVDISKFLEGRKLEELKPDEVYVLAKTLPGFSREQRLQAYRNILEDALRTGKADSVASLELLREVRFEIGVTDDEHRQIIQELGIDDAESILDPKNANTFESWVRLDSYRRVIEPILLGQLDQGAKLAEVLVDSGIADTIRHYREIYQVTEEEHAKVISDITGTGGMLGERAKRQLELLAENAALIFGLRCKMLADPEWRQIGSLLFSSSARRTTRICNKLFSILLTLGNTAESQAISSVIADLLGADIEAPLAAPFTTGTIVTWAESIDASLVNLLRGSRELDGDAAPAAPSSFANFDYRSVIAKGAELGQNLKSVVLSEDPLVGALALTALSYIDMGSARQVAAEVDRSHFSTHWLLTEVVNGLTGKLQPVESMASSQFFTVTLASVNNGQQTLTFAKDYVTVGRAPDNDVIAHGQAISSHHLAICRDGSQVQVRKTDPFASIFINGEACLAETATIEPGARVAFSPPTQPGALVVIDWPQESADYALEAHDTVTRLLWLSCTEIFREVELSSLADIAASVEIRRYQEGAWLCRAGDPAKDAFLLQSGAADILVSVNGQETKINTLREGALTGEIGVITGKTRMASIRISSPVARILTINGDRLRRLMKRDANVSMGMLSVVASYIKS